MDAAEWQRILDTNLTGTLRACQVFGRPMIEAATAGSSPSRRWPRSSGMFEVAAYTASKAGVAGLTRALAVEWAPTNVTVNAIAPGVFRTDLNSALLDSPRGQEFLTRTPMHRFGQLEELAGAAVFLASDAASFVTGHSSPSTAGSWRAESTSEAGARHQRSRQRRHGARDARARTLVSIGEMPAGCSRADSARPQVALRAIAAGQPVIKYGSPIGHATADIQAGAHVHTHNVASSRGRGDLDVLPNTPEPRLAEPSDPDPRPADQMDRAQDGHTAGPTPAESVRGSGRTP